MSTNIQGKVRKLRKWFKMYEKKKLAKFFLWQGANSIVRTKQTVHLQLVTRESFVAEKHPINLISQHTQTGENSAVR